MVATSPYRTPPATYNTGLPYLPARGRYAPRPPLEDRLEPQPLVFDLPRERPGAAEFLQAVVAAMKARYYQPNTVATYRNALAKFLRWAGVPPHRITQPTVRSVP